MSETGFDTSVLILLVGLVIVANFLAKSLLERWALPALVGYIGLGFLLRLADGILPVLDAGAWNILEFLGRVGVIVLLFRIGLESNVRGLLRQLRRASVIWVGDIALSAFAGYAATRFILGYGNIPGLFVAIAMSATSVAISTKVWRDAGALNSARGELLVDVAELDDLSGILFLAVLFAVMPVLVGGTFGGGLGSIASAAATQLVKFILFGALCLLFSIYAEERLTLFFRRIEAPPAPMLTVAAIGFVIAALAALLGFSVAIGAFFAGLIFSRDPEAVHIDASFGAIHELFGPFFFFFLGLSIDPAALTQSAWAGVVLLCAAFAGKLAGDGIPAYFFTGTAGAALIGFSMVPRAEIAMIVMQTGLGAGTVPGELYAAMVAVSMGTCMLSPLVVQGLLKRSSRGGERS